jgi:hypothetical protein
MVDITNPIDIQNERSSIASSPAPTNLEVIGSTAASDLATIGGAAIGRQFFTDEVGFKVTPEQLPENLRGVESLYRSGSQKELSYNIRAINKVRDWNDTINRSTTGQWLTAMAMSPVNIPTYFVAPELMAAKLFSGSIKSQTLGFAVGGGAAGLLYGSAFEIGKVKSVGENVDYESAAINITATTLIGATLSGGLKLTTSALGSAFDMSARNLSMDVLSIDALQVLQSRVKNAPMLNKAARVASEAEFNAQTLSSGGPSKAAPIIHKFTEASKEELAIQYTSFTQKIVGLIKLNRILEQDLTKNGFSILNKKRIEGDAIDRIITSNTKKIQYLDGLNTRIKTEQASRMFESSSIAGISDPWRITANWFTDSKFFTGIPRPLTDILQYKGKIGRGVDMLKKNTLMLAGGYEFKTVAVTAGLPNPESVLMNSAVERAGVLKLDRIMQESYAAATATPKNRYFGMRSPNNTVGTWKSGIESPEQWSHRVINDRLRDIPHSNPHEQRFSDEFINYFTNEEARLSASGQIGQSKNMADTILQIKEKIKAYDAELLNPRLTPESITYRNRRITELRTKIKGLEDDIKYMEQSKMLPKLDKEPYFSRIFDKEKIEANRSALKEILSNRFLKNGLARVYNVTKSKWEVISINNSVPKANSAADKWIDNFLKESDPLGVTAMANLSQSNNLMQRSLHITNKEIIDFLVTDPMVILKLYQSRVSPKYHFNRLFEGKSIDEVWSDMEVGLIDDGLKRSEIDKMGLKFKSLYFRVVGGVIREPSAMNQKIANGLKRWTSTTLLGKAGITATAEIGNILARHEFGVNLKALGSTLNSPEFRKHQQLIKEQYGEAFEINMGSLAMRVYDDLSTKMTSGAWDKFENLFFNMSGLGPVTQTLKLHEGMVYIHDLLGIAANIKNKTVSKFDMDMWTRFGLSIDDAAEIAKAPIQIENKLRMTDLDQWAGVGISEDATRKWKLAVNQSISQTVITGGPADRPLISDGIIYIKKNVANKIPYLSSVPEDNIMKGYVRIENALLTLPFQFMNWTFGAMNKLQANIAHDGLRNKMGGLVSLMGMGYMVAQLKTPNFVWDKMSDGERFTTAVEYSGIVGIYGDLATKGLQFSQQLGGDISMSPLQPKFQSEPSSVGAAATILGPAVSNISRVGKAVAGLNDDPAKSLRDGWKLIPGTTALGFQLPLNVLSSAFK